ncbi:hypothetical protein ACFL2M_02520 [Patescibacteria group bacterium]
MSRLQQHILKQAVSHSGRVGRRVDRDVFLRYYSSVKDAPQSSLHAKIITKSLERMIDKELLLGFGYRTRHRWFIEEVSLTPLGRKEARKLLGQQQKLPLKKKRGKHKK